MAERINIPRSNLPESAACGQWETLLADALDGVLRPEDEAEFTAHMAACAACTVLFDEARRGREWLEFLSPEPEIPAGLVDRILAHTGPRHKPALGALAAATAHGAMALPAGMAPAWQQPGFMGSVRRWAEPRLMMTVAMAFFSIALTLNLMGVRLTQVRFSDLRPMAVRSYMERRITMASVPFIRYYDHLRFIYEVQSQMRELRGEGEDSEPEKDAPAGAGESRKKDGGSRAQPPQQTTEPAAADGDFVQTSFREDNTGNREQGNDGTRERESKRDQVRAFRRLQTMAAKRASEGSGVWTA